MTQETSTTTDDVADNVGDWDVQTFNYRTEILSVLGALMHPVSPTRPGVAVDALLTLIAVARQDERTQCLDWLENLVAKADERTELEENTDE